jgi:cell wall-associated NlpC family hydrolase
VSILSPVRPPRQQRSGSGRRRTLLIVIIGSGTLMLLGLLVVPMFIVGGASLFFGGNGGGCTGTVTQPVQSNTARTIPANYLMWYKRVGQQYGIPWTILAGIGTVESDNGQTTLPGVHSGANAFGAAGPMQIGIGGAAGDEWGGLAVHPASEHVNGVANDEDGDGIASVYSPGDAIAGAAEYLVQHGVHDNVPGAIFAYNHLASYVQDVENYASQYATGGYAVTNQVTGCSTDTNWLASQQPPNQASAEAISFAQQQIGKPYLWGGTGPDSFDCSGLVMMAYRAAGVYIPRTSQLQWLFGPRVAPSAVEPGDLVFFAGGDGTPTAPGHVGLVIGKGKMIEAYATGFNIRISSYGTSSSPPGDQVVVGFTRPWDHARTWG